jgi:hypothetical protein
MLSIEADWTVRSADGCGRPIAMLQSHHRSLCCPASQGMNLQSMTRVMNLQSQRLGAGSGVRGAPPSAAGLLRPSLVPTRPQMRSSESNVAAGGPQQLGVRALASSNEAVFVLSRADETERDALKTLLMLNKTASSKVGRFQRTVGWGGRDDSMRRAACKGQDRIRSL